MPIYTDKITRWLSYLLTLCLYLTLLTVLLIGTKFLFPFITLKTIYFRSLIELALPLYVLLAWHNPAYRPRFNYLLWSLIAFLAVLFITAFIGVSPYRSLWGNIERGEGLLFISHLIVYSFILTQFFKTKRAWYNFFSFSILTSLLVGFYGLAQQYHFNWAIKNSSGARWSSTLGNAAYLGAYALGHFWLAVSLFTQRPKIYWKIFYVFAALFNAWLVFASETRGAMLALIFSVILFLLYLIFSSTLRYLKLTTSTGLLVILFVLFLAFSNPQQVWVKKFAPLWRLTTINLNDITIQSRLYALDSSWHGWRDRFLFGYGWENYEVVFNKYFHPEIYRDNGSQIWFDRAHNTILDVAIASGLIGLLVYLSIYFNAFIILWRRKKDLLAVSLFLLLTAHFIQNIFVFDSLPTYLMLFSVFAFIAFLDLPLRTDKDFNSGLRKIPLWLIVLAILFSSLSFYYFNLRPARANQLALSGLSAIHQGRLQSGIKLNLQAINLHTYQTQEIRERLAQAILGFNNLTRVKDKQVLKNNFQIAIQQLQDSLQRWPLHAQDYLFLMALYNQAGLTLQDPGYLLKVEPLGYQALLLSPTRPQIYFEMGKAQMYLGNFKRGLDYFQQAVALNPTTLDSHWNLLAAYAMTDQLQSTADQYQRMLALGLRENKSTLLRLAQIFSSPHLRPLLVKVYEKLTKLQPDNLNYWTKLAELYKVTGETAAYQKTIDYIQTNFKPSTD